ncbi:hypothetical protein RvY_08634-2 [Ramazzottius varieornatus]|uniref:Death domain-containing protein n=1 Tax=Ramazzottius varieornatus TaxID=947166 RepID=A0A1D1V951_RAMVA|nr:hypothetical protein RvY_08634-2 [Ramazzottius varieornatus]
MADAVPHPLLTLTELIEQKAKPSGSTTSLSSLTPEEIRHIEQSVSEYFIPFFPAHQSDDVRETFKVYLETAIRTVFWNHLKNPALVKFREVEWLIRFCIECAEKEIVEVALPYVLFQEGCDWGDNTEKEQIANLFVDLKDKWKSPKFSAAGRNILLRFTTELLSRLPKINSTSAKARGRLLCYVSARFPMWDKGAANMFGEINGGTTITTTGATNGLATNQHPNEKFAQLCNLFDMLRNPTLIIAKPSSFTTFRTAFEQTIEIMTPPDMRDVEHEEGEHVDDGNRLGILTSPTTNSPTQSSQFSSREDQKLRNSKFIADDKTLEHDLRQDDVKRNLLCRFLIVAQYIALPSKPKGAFEASDEQLQWCDRMVQTSLAILSRTQPNGPLYVERLIDLLESEAQMSIWKDTGCPPLPTLPSVDLSELPTSPATNQVPYPRVTRFVQGKERSIIRRSIKESQLWGVNKTAGSVEVTRLLSKGPNTPEEFQTLGYQPPTLDYFIPVVEQAAGPKDDKDIHDEKYQWRALRILGKRTHVHFSSETEKKETKNIGAFLERYVLDLADKIPVLQEAKRKHAEQLAARAAEAAAASTGPEAPDGGDEGDINVDAELIDPDGDVEMSGPATESTGDAVGTSPGDGSGGTGTGPRPLFTKEHIRNIASQIANDWERFAAILKFDADRIEYWKSVHTEPVEQAVQMLQVWMEDVADSGKDTNDELETFLGALKDYDL